MTVLTMIVVIVYSLACYSLGILILAGLTRNDYGTVSDVAIVGSAFAIGIGVLAPVWTGLALAGYLTYFTVIPVLGAILIARFLIFRQVYSPFTHLLKKLIGFVRQVSIVWILIVILIGLLILLTGLSSLLPPQPRGDALAFYMAMPKLVAHTGQLTPYPGNENLMKNPLLGEMHYAALFLLNGAFAAKLFAWIVGCFAALALAGLAKETGSGYRGQLLVLVSAFSSTAFTNLIWDGKVDAFAVGPVSAAFIWALQIKSDSSDAEIRKSLRITGLLLGMAITAKFSYLVFLPICLGLLVLWRLALRESFLPWSWYKLRSLMLFGVLLGIWTLLPLLTNVVKNLVLYKAPLAPLIESTQNPTTKALVASRFAPEVVEHINSTFPLSITYGLYQYQGGDLTPLVIGFLPIVFLLWRSVVRRTDAGLQLFVVAALGILIWIVVLPGVFVLRYFFPSLLLFIIFAAGLVDRLYNVKFHFPQVRGAAVLAAFIMAFVALHDLYPSAVYGLQYATGVTSACSLEELNYDASCRIAQAINREAQPGERIFTASFFTYWLNPELIECVSVPTGPAAVSVMKKFVDNVPEAELWEALYEAGFHYVIIDPLSHPDWASKLTLTSVPDNLTVEPLLDLDYGKAYRISSNNGTDLPNDCTGSNCCKK